MKCLELIIAISCWAIAVLWFKNSSSSEFPYEPLLAIIGGIGAFFDSLRRFEICSRVSISIQNPRINPWSFTGGKVDKTNVSIEIVIENGKGTDILIRAIEFSAPIGIRRSIGESNTSTRLVDLSSVGVDMHFPIIVSANSKMHVFAESTYDSTSLEKYDQASSLGKLDAYEYFGLTIRYSHGSKEKIISTGFSAGTTELISNARSKYEESGDHKGVISIIEKT